MITGALRILLAAFLVPSIAVAQEPQQDAPRTVPAGESVSVGATRVIEDGESSTRVSIFWQARDHLVPGFTVSDVTFEPEVRWFPRGRGSPFFLSTSVIYKHRRTDRFGGSLAIGVDLPWYGPVTTSVSLGWESVFAEGPADGPHWFRLQGGLLVTFPIASS